MDVEKSKKVEAIEANQYQNRENRRRLCVLNQDTKSDGKFYHIFLNSCDCPVSRRVLPI